MKHEKEKPTQTNLKRPILIEHDLSQYVYKRLRLLHRCTRVFVGEGAFVGPRVHERVEI